ncbi:preprotein translocase subunit SecD/SecD/SecF fusion protein [Aneurinibacillus soli]|uniref:Protein translocase subunit SecD n=1 Tax=Aneurinibacillus soli TaxID=1500254 RepID=A0A0U4WE16_9BACL|nr:protein translocase subunit SecD [Aneurinibacillus soli]PYE62469.1 preprotein translocase subunit SecD/SecD/SecF fusion protein [Aneurinibacillus soli]BAU27032.1 bifunctional preprotein translocase subunit SecD/SecF [Aneurinibacillus soli]
MIKWSRIVTLLIITAVIFGTVAMTGKKVAMNTTLGLDLRGGFEILYEVAPLDPKQKATKQTLQDAVHALESRVNVLGVSEPEIQAEGENRIRVRLAGVTDQQKARDLIGKPAKLTFRDAQGKILMDGGDLAENGAQGAFDQYQRPIVSLKFKDPKKFADVTQKYIGKPMAIYLDQELITAPTIQSVIPNGVAQIDGQKSIEEAKNLAAILNAGALPVQMKEVFSTSVGAKLGQEALHSGVEAGLIGTAIVLVFMMVYYRMPGVIACITLVAYIYLLMLMQNLMHATLTLPGIAAFILGIGMAVDANIIMYERIKEELRSGKSYLSAMRAGSKRSLSTILDANVTSIIGAIVLFWFGSSSIRGFAITLILSILVSLVTAVAGSRLLLNLAVRSNLFNKPGYYGVKERDIREL